MHQQLPRRDFFTLTLAAAVERSVRAQGSAIGPADGELV
jgi:hypothetical protein